MILRSRWVSAVTGWIWNICRLMVGREVVGVGGRAQTGVVVRMSVSPVDRRPWRLQNNGVASVGQRCRVMGKLTGQVDAVFGVW